MRVLIGISIRGVRGMFVTGAVGTRGGSRAPSLSRMGEYLINQQLYKLVIEKSRLSGKALGLVN